MDDKAQAISVVLPGEVVSAAAGGGRGPLRIGVDGSGRPKDGKLVLGLDLSRGDDSDLLPDEDVAVIPVPARVWSAG
jgi:hypothetical protein